MIPNDLKQEGENAMNFIFDFWKRTSKVKFYKTPSEIIVSSNPDWNSDFGSPSLQNIVKTAQSQEFECRIWFSKDPAAVKKIDGEQNSDISVYSPKTFVRIQMKPDAYSWIGDSKSFWIEGERYELTSDVRKIGTFSDFQFFEIVLQKNM